jgi:hypothetical protein
VWDQRRALRILRGITKGITANIYPFSKFDEIVIEEQRMNKIKSPTASHEKDRFDSRIFQKIPPKIPALHPAHCTTVAMFRRRQIFVGK